MKARAFNPQIFLELLCYCVFGGLMLYLVKSGKYLSYVTPRMEPYLYFTAIVMGIWTLAGLSRLFRPQYKIRSSHCYILAIPILLLCLPHSSLGISDLSGYYIGGNTLSGQANRSSYGTSPSSKQSLPDNSGSGISTGIPTDAPADSAAAPSDASSSYSEDELPSSDIWLTDPADTTAGTSEGEYSTLLPGLDEVNRIITVSDREFSVWLSELYTNMENYKGYTIIMTGYVFKDPEILKENEFAAARLMMSCCAADLSPAGLVCKYDKASELETDSWVTVEGTLIIEQYESEGEKYDDPQILVTKITPAEEVEGYVYPFY